jgi:hypothetical protein
VCAMFVEVRTERGRDNNKDDGKISLIVNIISTITIVIPKSFHLFPYGGFDL